MSDTHTFEDRLWDALKHEAGRPEDELPTDRFRAGPVRRPATARRVGLGLAAAAVAGSVLAVLPGGSGAQSAYALEVQKDGKVKISVPKASEDQTQGSGVTGVTRAAVVRVDVDYNKHYSGFDYACEDGEWHHLSRGEVLRFPVSGLRADLASHIPQLSVRTGIPLDDVTMSRLPALAIHLCFPEHR